MTPSRYAELRVQEIGRRVAARTAQVLEAVAAVAVFGAIGVLLAWRG